MQLLGLLKKETNGGGRRKFKFHLRHLERNLLLQSIWYSQMKDCRISHVQMPTARRSACLRAEIFRRQCLHSFDSFAVMNSAGIRYTTCGQELLAVVFALEKFSVQLMQNKILLNTDNPALIVLQKCAVTLYSVAILLVTTEEYNIELQHIMGVENYLVDILSLNPTGLQVKEIRNLSKLDTISSNDIELKTDRAVLRNRGMTQDHKS